jgi:hypothetical protein
MPKKYNFLYKITNKETGEYYIGKHSTDDINDGYFGSGRRIKAAVRKHGMGKFDKEIIEFFQTPEEVNVAEKSLVTEDMIKDPKCMNLCIGGQGGTLHDWSDESKKKLSESLSGRDIHWGGKISAANTGRTFGKETKRKMSEARSGNKNSAWVDCDVDLIVELHMAGLGVRTISTKTGYGRKVIRARLVERGLLEKCEYEK